MNRLHTFAVIGILLVFNFSQCKEAAPSGSATSSTIADPSTPNQVKPDQRVKPDQPGLSPQTITLSKEEIMKWKINEDTGPWKQARKQMDEQKYAEADQTIDQIRQNAKKSGNEPEWLYATIEQAKLKIALSGFETAVTFLQEQPSAQSAIAKFVFDLYYSQALLTYLDEYSYEIGQREKVATSKKGDLKTWTRGQIVTEIQTRYTRLFENREALSLVPSASFAYIKPNNYPTEVRGTLRDVLSYFAVGFYGNTSYWSAEEENSVYELVLSTLLGNQVQEIQSLSDASIHPLRKVVWILSDLESFHQKQGHLDAALEARLERLRRLYTSFSKDAEKIQIREQLQAILPSYRTISWWSMGQAQLARFFMQETQDDQNLVKAHEEAQRGYQAYPDSVGGKTCLTWMKKIEAPHYQVQMMNMDGPGKRSLQIEHQNVEHLYFRAYWVDVENRLKTFNSYRSIEYTNGELVSVVEAQKPIFEWHQPISNVADYKQHRTYAIPPMKDAGTYLVVASANADFSFSKNHLVHTLFTVSDLVILTDSESERRNQVMVVSGKNGEPIVNAVVQLYKKEYEKKAVLLQTVQTNEQGIASLAFGQSYYDLALVVKKGKDLSFQDDYSLWSYDTTHEPLSTIIYTDRSIYRPLQKIFWKTVAYRKEKEERKYQILPESALVVRLLDVNGKEVSSIAVKTNEFGSAAGEFPIPTGRALGSWRIETSFPGKRIQTTSYSYVKVEEYKRPTFEVSFQEQKGKLRLNQTATFVGEAKYYFGMAVTSGKAKWKVMRNTHYPWWWSHWGYFRAEPQKKNQMIASGVASIKEDGTFDVTFIPKADEKVGKEVTYSYQVEADVTDEGGETRSAHRSFQLGFVDIKAVLWLDVAIAEAGKSYPLQIIRSNLNGVPQSGQGSIRLVPLIAPVQTSMPSNVLLPVAPNNKQTQGKKTAGDFMRPRWDTHYDPAAQIAAWQDLLGQAKDLGRVTHNEKGEAHIDLPPLSAGAYRIYYETKDAFGETYTNHSDLVVVEEQKSLTLPLQFFVEKSQGKVGETNRFFVNTGFTDQPIYFEVFRGNKLLERRKIIPSASMWIDRKITEEDRGGFWTRVWMVQDHQLISLSQSVVVPWDNKELKIELSTFRDKLKPGQMETWQLKLQDPHGKPLTNQTAEILAYMYDRSLDFFGPHLSPQMLGLFSTGSYGWDRLSAHIKGSQAHQIWKEHVADWFVIPESPELNGDKLHEFSRYGIGGLGNRHYFHKTMAVPAPMAEMAKMAPAKPSNGRARGEEENKKDSDGVLDAAGTVAKDKKLTDTAVETPSAEAPVRQNFSETAFWQPQLLSDRNGMVKIEFSVPDSVTSWNFLVRAFTKDFSSASLQKEVKTIKELMVRPYTPRFFREGDLAELKVMVNHAGEKETLSGTLELNWIDPETNKVKNELFGLKNASQSFTVAPGKSKTLSFAVQVPKKVGMYALKAQARAGSLSDGELRPIPILPSRMHLVQSKFVTLRNADKRTMTFPDLQKNDDPTRINEQLVVTVDAQLFATVLKALPYLVQYPYECAEQTLNRFLSTGIVSSVYQKNPSLAKLAETFAKRPTQMETFSALDPNRKMTLEETPWVRQAEGGSSDSLINVLNPEMAKAQRDEALERLKKLQRGDGGFSWFPGGPDSPYMTLYLMHGFAKAAEFQVEIPKDMVQRGWNYLARHFRDRYVNEMIQRDVGWEFLTFLNYVASSYPDESFTGNALTKEERQQILAFSFKHWKEHSPYLKGFLALTLKRMGRPQDAKLVFDSVMDSAKTEPDQGTFWQPEDRSWLWYQDTIESHAFALRVLMELDPQNPKKDGLVLWLLLNKKMNQWKSTKATAEVIYSLVHYLQKEQALGIKESATVTIGTNPKIEQRTFVFEPDQYVGKTQVILPAEKINSQAATITVEKPTKGFMFASANWHFSTDELPKEDRGDFFHVSRTYFKRVSQGKEVQLIPLTDGASLQVGDEVEVQLSIRSKHAAEYVHLRDPRGAGFEPAQVNSGYRFDLVGAYYQEIRDSGTNFFFEQLPQGEFTFKYRLRVNMAGSFRVGPATLQSMYAPEFTAYSQGHLLKIQP